MWQSARVVPEPDSFVWVRLWLRNGKNETSTTLHIAKPAIAIGKDVILFYPIDRFCVVSEKAEHRVVEWVYAVPPSEEKSGGA